MKLEVTGWMGAPDGSYPIDQITIFSGHNTAGKTSMLRAIQAVLSNGNPCGLSASRMDSYRKDDKKNHLRIHLDGEGGSVTLDQKMQRTISGLAPAASEAALGLVSLSNHRKPAERQEAWNKIIAITPTRQELMDTFGDLAEDERTYIIESVLSTGFDEIYKVQKARMATLKREWSDVVAKCDGNSETWGSKKAEEWRPEGWDPKETRTTHELEEIMTEAKTQISVARQFMTSYKEESARTRIQEEKRENLVAIDKCNEKLEAYKREEDALERLIINLNSDMNKVKSNWKERIMRTCPECGSKVPDEEANIAIDAHNRDVEMEYNQKKRYQDDNIEKQRTVREKMHASSRNKREYERAIESLQKTLDNIPDDKVFDTREEAEDAVAEAQARYEETQRVLIMTNAVNSVNRINKAMDSLVDVVHKLGPDGLRRSIRSRKLKGIQDRISQLNRDFWTVVLDNETLEVTVSGRPIDMCSRAQQWWASTIVRGAVALFDNSKVLLTDDINDTDIPNASAWDLLETISQKGDIKVIGACTRSWYDAEHQESYPHQIHNLDA